MHKELHTIKVIRDYMTTKCSGLTNCSGPLILDTFQATFSNSAIF